MIKDFWSSIEDNLDTPVLGVKVGHQYFNDNRRIYFANREDSPSEVVCAAILKVVSRDRGDDDMFESQSFDRLGNASRFVMLESKRLRGRDRTESAGAGA